MNPQCIEVARCGEEEFSALANGTGGDQARQSDGKLRIVLLSKRQEEILLASCLGTPDKIIADKLGVSPRTLEGHWRAIHRKLGSVNRCQAGFLFAGLRENTREKVPA